MRAVLFIAILAILVTVAAVASGYLRISQLRGGDAPEMSASRNGLSAKAGQAPAFDVETGSIKVGTEDATVKVPTLEVQKVQKPGQNQAPAATNTAP